MPFTLSTLSICSIEDVREHTSKPFWFQLYVMRDREFIARLVEATHPQAEGAPETVSRHVKFGASPRAAIALASRASGLRSAHSERRSGSAGVARPGEAPRLADVRRLALGEDVVTVARVRRPGDREGTSCSPG